MCNIEEETWEMKILEAQRVILRFELWSQLGSVGHKTKMLLSQIWRAL